jgi:xanthine dehydrogenase accessory factor
VIEGPPQGFGVFAIVREAMSALEEGTARLVRLDPEADDDPRPGLAVYPMTCQGEGSVDVYLEPVMAKPALLVLGRSPVAEALARLAAPLDYAITVADPFADPARFPDATVGADVEAVCGQATASTWIVVATMGEGDEEALEAATRSLAKWIGLVASRKKGGSLFAHLRQAEISPDRIAAIECPAGLDLGARTPPEIALTILAGIMKQRSGVAAHGDDPASVPDVSLPGPPSAIDPVCGMSVDTPRHTAMHAGREYRFCCPHCRKAFLADPGKYIAAARR